MQIDRRGQLLAIEAELTLVRQEHSAEQPVALSVAIAGILQKPLRIVDVFSGYEDVQVVVFALGEIAVQCETEGRPLERNERNTAGNEENGEAFEIARKQQRTCLMTATEFFEFVPGIWRDVVPGCRTETLVEAQAYTVKRR